MSVIQEFKKFIMRGNAVDIAVGIIIGAAFGKIVSALVEGILMPPILLVLSSLDFSQMGWELKAAVEKDGKIVEPALRLRYGMLIQAILDFLIVGACLFTVVKVMNKLQDPPEEKPKEVSDEVKLLTEIRDLLKSA